jgi:chromosome segregation ATPase
MWDQELQAIVKFTRLNQRMVQINIAQQQKQLEAKRKELQQVEQSYNQFLTHSREFKRKFFKFILHHQLAKNARLIAKTKQQRKDKIAALLEQTNQLNTEIATITKQLTQLQAKLTKLKMKLEKYANLPDLIEFDE